MALATACAHSCCFISVKGARARGCARFSCLLHLSSCLLSLLLYLLAFANSLSLPPFDPSLPRSMKPNQTRFRFLPVMAGWFRRPSTEASADVFEALPPKHWALLEQLEAKYPDAGRGVLLGYLKHCDWNINEVIAQFEATALCCK
jgi:hypothetical protein